MLRNGLFCMTARTVWQSRDSGAFTSVAIAEKIHYPRGHETIVSRYSWKTSMNKSSFQLAPCAGPAYLALADAVELAILAGSV
jgi:hypothetical protein